MAQWKGLGSGRSHATKVKSLEEALTVSVAALNSSAGIETEKKMKAIYGIAKRLLSARLHLVQSQLSFAREKQKASGLEALVKREQEIRMGGIEAIISTCGISGRMAHEPNKPLKNDARKTARAS